MDILIAENLEGVNQSLIPIYRLPSRQGRATEGTLVVPFLPTAIYSFGRNTANTLGVCDIKVLVVSGLVVSHALFVQHVCTVSFCFRFPSTRLRESIQNIMKFILTVASMGTSVHVLRSNFG